MVQASGEARRNQLMRDMAHLRLRDEVSRLEGSLSGAAGADDTVAPLSARRDGTPAPLPPYVIADAPTLCDQLSVIRQLAASSRFIFIIPTVGQFAQLTMNMIIFIHHKW